MSQENPKAICPHHDKHECPEELRLCKARLAHLAKLQREAELTKKLDEELAKIEFAASKASARAN